MYTQILHKLTIHNAHKHFHNANNLAVHIVVNIILYNVKMYFVHNAHTNITQTLGWSLFGKFGIFIL